MIETLTRAGTTITFNADPYYVAERDFGGVTHDLTERGGPSVDIARVGAVDTSSLRRVRYVVDVVGTNMDDCLTDKAALLAVLPNAAIGETATLTVSATGSAYTGTLTVVGVEGVIEMPYDLRHDVGHVATVAFTLVCHPWIYGAVTDLFASEPVSLPAVLDLSTMVGEAAPIDFLITNTATDIHQVVIGVYPEVATIDKFVIEAVDLSWPAGTNLVGGGGGGWTWVRTTSATGVYADIDVTDFRPGSYLVYANMRRDAACDPATFDSDWTAYSEIEGTTFRQHFIDIVSLPCSAVRGAATSTLRVYLYGDGTDGADLHTISFVPASWGVFGWHGSTTATHAHLLRFADGLVYADEIASLASRIGDSLLLAGGGTLVVIGEGTAEAATLAVDIDASYTTRWEQFPTS